MSEQTNTAQTTTSVETTMTTETVIEAILDSLSYSSYTAYRIHTVINAAFAILEIDRKIEPQRMYGAAKSGQINGVKAVKGDAPSYTRDEVKDFAIKFIEGALKSGGTTSRVEMKSLIAIASAKLAQ
jgi:hypothetical protein